MVSSRCPSGPRLTGELARGLCLSVAVGLTRGLVSEPPEEALALGLVHRVVPAEKLMEEALSLAKELAQGPTRAYALTKKLLLETYRLSLTEALALEAVLQGQAGQTQDHEEGVRAFREKRPPRFQGR